MAYECSILKWIIKLHFIEEGKLVTKEVRIIYIKKG